MGTFVSSISSAVPALPDRALSKAHAVPTFPRRISYDNRDCLDQLSSRVLGRLEPVSCSTHSASHAPAIHALRKALQRAHRISCTATPLPPDSLTDLLHLFSIGNRERCLPEFWKDDSFLPRLVAGEPGVYSCSNGDMPHWDTAQYPKLHSYLQSNYIHGRPGKDTPDKCLPLLLYSTGEYELFDDQQHNIGQDLDCPTGTTCICMAG